MTNEQWLKSLDTEELAKLFKKILHNGLLDCYFKYDARCRHYTLCQECISDWLKQERGE